MDGSGFGELRPCDPGRPSSVTITLYNPTGTDQTLSVSTTKFTPDTFGGTVHEYMGCWNLQHGRPRDHCAG